jgi:transposase
MRQDQAGWRAITSTRGLTTDERARFKQFERENVELRRANEILRLASAYFAKAELDRRAK